MSSFFMHRDWVSITEADFTTANDGGVWQPLHPAYVLRWGIVATTLIDVGAGMTVNIDWRPTIGSDTDRAEIASIVRTSDIAVGQGIWQDIVREDSDGSTALDGNLLFTAPTSPYLVIPGGEVILEIEDAADTGGAGYAFIEYLKLPWADDAAGTFLANMTQVADYNS